MKKNTIYLIVGVLVVLIIAVIIFGNKTKDAEFPVPADAGLTPEMMEYVKNNPVPAGETSPEGDAPVVEPVIEAPAVQDGKVNLKASVSGFEPREFTVDAGKAVTISLTSTDKTHVFKFDDPELKGKAIGVAGGETRTITFEAPAPGDYSFFCDVPGHRARGETGVMHTE